MGRTPRFQVWNQTVRTWKIPTLFCGTSFDSECRCCSRQNCYHVGRNEPQIRPNFARLASLRHRGYAVVWTDQTVLVLAADPTTRVYRNTNICSHAWLPCPYILQCQNYIMWVCLSQIVMNPVSEARYARDGTGWSKILCAPDDYNTVQLIRGPGSSVGIATELRAGRPVIESWWGWDFPPVQTGLGAHSASYTMGTGSFPGVKCGRGVLLTTHSLPALRSWKSRAIPLHPCGPQPGL